MRKSLLQLQYSEEQKAALELKKIESAEENYKITTLYQRLAITIFVLNLVMIISAVVWEKLLIAKNDFIISLIILLFSIISLSLLVISNFYKEKTMNILYNYYEKEKVLE